MKKRNIILTILVSITLLSINLNSQAINFRSLNGSTNFTASGHKLEMFVKYNITGTKVTQTQIVELNGEQQNKLIYKFDLKDLEEISTSNGHLEPVTGTTDMFLLSIECRSGDECVKCSTSKNPNFKSNKIDFAYFKDEEKEFLSYLLALQNGEGYQQPNSSQKNQNNNKNVNSNDEDEDESLSMEKEPPSDAESQLNTNPEQDFYGKMNKLLPAVTQNVSDGEPINFTGPDVITFGNKPTKVADPIVQDILIKSNQDSLTKNTNKSPQQINFIPISIKKTHQMSEKETNQIEEKLTSIFPEEPMWQETKYKTTGRFKEALELVRNFTKSQAQDYIKSIPNRLIDLVADRNNLKDKMPAFIPNPIKPLVKDLLFSDTPKESSLGRWLKNLKTNITIRNFGTAVEISACSGVTSKETRIECEFSKQPASAFNFLHLARGQKGQEDIVDKSGQFFDLVAPEFEMEKSK